MTFCYQNKCDDIWCPPCNPCNYQTYDCRSPCRDWAPWGCRDRSPCNTSCYPYSSCYTRNCTYRRCYPCYRW